jgi:1,4-dihydroxy-2-naphthoyl-CoA hydrolase
LSPHITLQYPRLVTVATRPPIIAAMSRDTTAWTPERVRRLIEGTMLETIGLIPLEIERGRFLCAIEHRPALAIRSGVFHAGTLATLADSAATFAALTVTDPQASMDQSLFPLAVQLSTAVIRNTDRGRITAEARVMHAGRTTQVVETQVKDEQERLLALVTTTHLVVRRSGS